MPRKGYLTDKNQKSPIEDSLTCGVTGNTSDSGSEESRFEPWQVNLKMNYLRFISWVVFFVVARFGGIVAVFFCSILAAFRRSQIVSQKLYLPVYLLKTLINNIVVNGPKGKLESKLEA